MRKIIVDGYNLIYAHPELQERVRAESRRVREILISILAEHIRTRKARVILVFDSRRSRAPFKLSLPPGIEVVFSKTGVTADEVIVKMMESEPEPGGVTVVSSDYKDIGRVAKSLGVQLVSADAFWREILREKKRRAKITEKPTSISNSEIQYWLREFVARRRRSKNG